MILRVEDLMPILGIGRNTAYELIRSGQIRSVRIGRQMERLQWGRRYAEGVPNPPQPAEGRVHRR